MISSPQDPFSMILALQRALESRRESDWMGARTAGIGGYPPINIFQQGDDFVAVVELPGIARENLNIEAKENTIRIQGQKTVDYGKTASMHRRERLSGTFDRTISLPMAIDTDRIRAEYNDGVLALYLPCAQSAKPRSIKVS